MVGAYWLGFKRGFKNAIWIILTIWRIVPPIWRGILEELSLYLFLSSSKKKLEWLGLIGWGLIGDLEMIYDHFSSFKLFGGTIPSIWRNRSFYLEEPILQFGGIDPSVWRNQSSSLVESILLFGEGEKKIMIFITVMITMSHDHHES